MPGFLMLSNGFKDVTCPPGTPSGATGHRGGNPRSSELSSVPLRTERGRWERVSSLPVIREAQTARPAKSFQASLQDSFLEDADDQLEPLPGTATPQGQGR